MRVTASLALLLALASAAAWAAKPPVLQVLIEDEGQFVTTGEVIDADKADDLSKLATGEFFYVPAVVNSQTVKLFTLLTKRKMQAAKDALVPPIRDLGFEVILKGDQVLSTGPLGEGRVSAIGLGRVRATPESLSQYRDSQHWTGGAPSWVTKAYVRAAVEHATDASLLLELTRNENVCGRVFSIGPVWGRIFEIDEAEALSQAARTVKFHENGCNRLEAGKAMIAAGKIDEVEDALDRLGETSSDRWVASELKRALSSM